MPPARLFLLAFLLAGTLAFAQPDAPQQPPSLPPPRPDVTPPNTSVLVAIPAHCNGRPGQGGAVSVGVGCETDTGYGGKMWDASGHVVWQSHLHLPGGSRFPGAPVPLGVLAWDGATFAVMQEDWPAGPANVVVYSVNVPPGDRARVVAESVARGQGAAAASTVDPNPDGWFILPWDSFAGIPPGPRLYVLAPAGDTDADGLPDGIEAIVWHTDRRNPDTDGDTRGDGLEVAFHGNPLEADNTDHLAINAFWTDPDASGRSWVELYSSARAPVSLDGTRLETTRDGQWHTVLEFPAGTVMGTGTTMLIGEENVPGADFRADLGFPARWPWQPLSGVRLVWDGVPNANILDAAIVGGAHFPENSPLDRSGWDPHKGIRPHGADPVVRRYAGLDNNHDGDWTTDPARVPHVAGAVIDSDGDGISDDDELSGACNPFGEPTNPYNADSDGDGLSDADECRRYRTNPDAWDTDGDIFPHMPQGTLPRDWPGTDPWEIDHGWDPLVPDQNSNGIPDGFDQALGTETLQPRN